MILLPPIISSDIPLILDYISLGIYIYYPGGRGFFSLLYGVISEEIFIKFHKTRQLDTNYHPFFFEISVKKVSDYFRFFFNFAQKLSIFLAVLTFFIKNPRFLYSKTIKNPQKLVIYTFFIKRPAETK